MLFISEIKVVLFDFVFDFNSQKMIFRVEAQQRQRAHLFYHGYQDPHWSCMSR